MITEKTWIVDTMGQLEEVKASGFEIRKDGSLVLFNHHINSSVESIENVRAYAAGQWQGVSLKA